MSGRAPFLDVLAFLHPLCVVLYNHGLERDRVHNDVSVRLLPTFLPHVCPPQVSHQSPVNPLLLVCKNSSVNRTTAALLQCALSHSSRPGDTGEWGTLSAVSTASVARHCGTMIKSCIGMPWEAKVDVPHWLRELESLKVGVNGAGRDCLLRCIYFVCTLGPRVARPVEGKWAGCAMNQILLAKHVKRGSWWHGCRSVHRRPTGGGRDI